MKQDWNKLASENKKFLMSLDDDLDIQSLLSLYESSNELTKAPKCSNCGKKATKQCSQCKKQW